MASKRNTIQKSLVLDAVNKIADHPTADEVYDAISQTYPDISVATVYRNLHSLVDSGMITRVSVPNGADRFDHIITDHQHFLCDQCGTYFDIELPITKKIDDDINKRYGLIVTGHEIIVKGICNRCRSM